MEVVEVASRVLSRGEEQIRFLKDRFLLLARERFTRTTVIPAHHVDRNALLLVRGCSERSSSSSGQAQECKKGEKMSCTRQRLERATSRWTLRCCWTHCKLLWLKEELPCAGPSERRPPCERGSSAISSVPASCFLSSLNVGLQ